MPLVAGRFRTIGNHFALLCVLTHMSATTVGPPSERPGDKGIGSGEFERVLEEQLDMLYNLTRRLSDSREEAEDLLQDSILAAWKAWQRHGPPDSAGAWLATICLNNARSRWRRSRARPLEYLDPAVGERLVAPERVDTEALANIEAAAVHRAMAQLPQKQREAICLMSLCGFTASQSATILGVPRNTVLSRAHRGHKALAVLLLDWVQSR